WSTISPPVLLPPRSLPPRHTPTHSLFVPFFFSNNPHPTQTSPLSLHDALPISRPAATPAATPANTSIVKPGKPSPSMRGIEGERSEEHTSELQSLTNLVCRLLLEKKKKPIMHKVTHTHPRARGNTLNATILRHS